MPSTNMQRIIDYAQRNLDNVSVGVTAPLEPPTRGVGIEFTIQKKGLRWGFRLRHNKREHYALFHVTEQRPGLFFYGIRGRFGGLQQKHCLQPLKLHEIVERWPTGFWPESLTILKRFARISA